MNTFLDLSAKVGLSHCPEFPNTRCNQREKWKDHFPNESTPPSSLEPAKGCGQAQEITGLAFWGTEYTAFIIVANGFSVKAKSGYSP